MLESESRGSAGKRGGGGSKGGGGRKHRGVKGSKAKEKARSMRLAF